MRMREVAEEMGELEARYHDLHRAGKSARLEISRARSGTDYGMVSLLEWRLDCIEREKGEILRRVERIEDNLIGDEESELFKEDLIEDSVS